VRFPNGVRTWRDKLAFLARRGYLWARILLVQHQFMLYNQIMKRVHPNFYPVWRNLRAVAKYT
jgi:hypothetical protein